MAESTDSSSREMSGGQGQRPFINEGYLRWEKMRADWRGSKSRSASPVLARASSPSAVQPSIVVAKNVDVDDVIERVFSNVANGHLQQPLPLGQMIDSKFSLDCPFLLL